MVGRCCWAWQCRDTLQRRRGRHMSADDILFGSDEASLRGLREAMLDADILPLRRFTRLAAEEAGGAAAWAALHASRCCRQCARWQASEQ